MGGNPGSSAACLECRQRKKKCGLEKPSCLRCMRSGRQCSGRRQSRIFVSRTANNFQQTGKQALNAAFHARYLGPTDTVAIDNSLSLTSNRLLYHAVLDEFNPGRELCVFSGDRSPDRPDAIHSDLAEFARGLIRLTSLNIELLDLSVFALLAKFLGSFRGDSSLVGLARSSYTEALGRFHQQLDGISAVITSNTDKRQCQIALQLCLSMQYFEMINWTPSARGSGIHVNGALSLLRIMTPRMCRLPVLKPAFNALRVLATNVALSRRQGTFLAEPQWRSIPFEGQQMTMTETIYDAVIQLPTFLERTDALEQSYLTGSAVHNDCVNLIDDYRTLKQAMDAWIQDFAAAEPAAFWYLDRTNMSSQPVVYEDPICRPKFSDNAHGLRFRDNARAAVLARYWGFRLELVLGLEDLRRILAAMPQSATYDRIFEQVGLNFPSEEPQKLSWMISQAKIYMDCCLEGHVAAHGLWDIMTRYQQRQQRLDDFDWRDYPSDHLVGLHLAR